VEPLRWSFLLAGLASFSLAFFCLLLPDFVGGSAVHSLPSSLIPGRPARGEVVGTRRLCKRLSSQSSRRSFRVVWGFDARRGPHGNTCFPRQRVLLRNRWFLSRACGASPSGSRCGMIPVRNANLESGRGRVTFFSSSSPAGVLFAREPCRDPGETMRSPRSGSTRGQRYVRSSPAWSGCIR